MKKNKNFLVSIVTAIGLTIFFITSSFVLAQVKGDITRIELQRHDLSFPGREMVQAVVKIGAGETFPQHRHPGEEVIYVLEGLLEYRLDGKDAITLKKGEVLFIPANTIHSAKNVGKAMV